MHNTPNKTWFERNWKWLVSFGCLTTIIVSVGVIAAIWYGVTEAMKTFPPYQQALEIAKSNHSVTDLLGQPIKEGLFFSGAINQVNDTGDANISIPLSGPNGKATLQLKAKREKDQWILLELTLNNEKSKEPIQLPTSPSPIKKY
jgi:hypothetical protein